MAVEETTVEETVQLTPVQKRGHDLNDLRRQLVECMYNPEPAVYVLSQHPDLVKSVKELVKKVEEMKELVSQRYDYRY